MQQLVGLIAGSGLGTSYSSLNQIGQLLPTQKFGQAGLELYANATNGNVALKGPDLQIADGSGAIDFSYYYNSQAASSAQAWCIGAVNRFQALPNPQNNSPSIVTFIEPDGHETTYTHNPNYDTYYFAPNFGDGTPYLYYDNKSSHWTRYHPGTRITEVYDNQGYLISRTNQEGKTARFEYDTSSPRRLTAVTGCIGNRYEIRSANNAIGIYAIENGQAIPLMMHTLDGQNRITNTQTPDGKYQINYIALAI